MKRQLRKFAGRWVRPFAPQFLRQAWGGPLYGFRPSSSCARLENDEASGTVTFCDATTRTGLRLPEKTRASLCYWAQANGKVREEWQALMREMRSHRVLFDIGSYDGTEALLFCTASPEHRAVVFEPSRDPMRGLQESLQANGLASQVVVRETAIGDTNDRRQMYLGPEGMLEIVEGAGVPEWNLSPTFVEFRRLDDECRELDLVPDLIRMDVDACELDVMRGAEHILSTHRPTIIMEIHLDLLEKRGQSAREICDLFHQHQYALFSCLDEPLSPSRVFDAFDAVTNIVARPQ